MSIAVHVGCGDYWLFSTKKNILQTFLWDFCLVHLVWVRQKILYLICSKKIWYIFINKALCKKTLNSVCLQRGEHKKTLKLFIQCYKTYIIYYWSRFNSWLLICNILEWQNMHRINQKRVILLINCWRS